jgi:4a-hydroxytetrahydrobiopterin dehydratase
MQKNRKIVGNVGGMAQSPYKMLLCYNSSYFCIMWTENNNALEATFLFKNFKQAFAFMTRVAFEAERLNHHPDWSNVWNRVSFRLNTHDAGNKVTDLDHQLAAAIDLIYVEYKPI